MGGKTACMSHGLFIMLSRRGNVACFTIISNPTTTSYCVCVKYSLKLRNMHILCILALKKRAKARLRKWRTATVAKVGLVSDVFKAGLTLLYEICCVRNKPLSLI